MTAIPTVIPTVRDVAQAVGRIATSVRRTPVWRVPETGITLKREDLQISGSFKIRGVANHFLSATPRKVVAASSGNHGIAVATLARSLGIEAVIVMTAISSQWKKDTITALGAEVVCVDAGFDERNRIAEELAATTRARFVSSSDDFHVIAGQGSVGWEIAHQAPGSRVVYVPVGGGGLLAGLCLAKHLWVRPPRIVGVEPASAARYMLSLRAGKPVTVRACDTLADGLRGQSPGRLCLPIVSSGVDEIVTVTDHQISDAMARLQQHGVYAEPSAAAALAAAFAEDGDHESAVVLSGGNIAAPAC